MLEIVLRIDCPSDLFGVKGSKRSEVSGKNLEGVCNAGSLHSLNSMALSSIHCDKRIALKIYTCKIIITLMIDVRK